MQVHFSDSFVNFLSGCTDKIGCILFKLYCRQRQRSTRWKKWHSNAITTNEIDYLTMRQDGQLSFLPTGKPLKLNDDGDWSREGRQDGKPSRVIRKIFHPRFLRYLTDKDFENFANVYKSKSTANGYTFELWDAKDIKKAYKMKRVSSGTLGSSCMNDDTRYLDLYHHCDKLKILVLLDKEGRLNGRALVWNISDTITLMDRVYSSSDHLVEMFIEYAEKNKWYRKANQGAGVYTSLIDPKGERVCRVFKIETRTDFDSYPYIDTFQFGGDGYITNNDSGDHLYAYDCTDGERTGGESDDRVYSEIEDRDIHEDDAVYISHGERQYRDNYAHRDNCVRIHGDWYYGEDDNIVEINNRWYLKDDDDVVYCEDGEYRLMDDCTEINGDWYDNDELIYCEDGEYRLEDDCVKVDGEWHAEDSDDIVMVDGEWYLKTSDDIVECADGEYRLIDDCIEIKGKYFPKAA